MRWSAPLFFANANLFRDRIRRAGEGVRPAARWVLVAAEPITDIDTTAGAMLTDLDLELNARRHPPGLRRARRVDVRDMIVRYGLLETIDQGHLYRSVTEAVEAFQREGA